MSLLATLSSMLVTARDIASQAPNIHALLSQLEDIFFPHIIAGKEAL